MDLTREQAIEEHRKMWRWVAVETRRRQKVLRPGDYLEEFYPNKIISEGNFCCEYAKPLHLGHCDNCPIDWKSRINRRMCNNKDDPSDRMGFLEQWCRAANNRDWYSASHLAANIAELPERNIEPKEVMKQEKPPVGVKPYYISSGKRINSLAKAIQRYSTTKNYKTIKLWAGEIICQCKLAEIMTEYENPKNSESMDN